MQKMENYQKEITSDGSDPGKRRRYLENAMQRLCGR